MWLYGDETVSCMTTICSWLHDFLSPHLMHTAYYRGAMGILLVYDITDESSFNNIRNWMKNIDEHASDNVNKVRI